MAVEVRKKTLITQLRDGCVKRHLLLHLYELLEPAHFTISISFMLSR